MGGERRTRGFWRGLLTGLLIAAAAALALAFWFPPLRAPSVSPAAMEPPGEPIVPEGVAAAPSVPAGGPLLAPAPAPLIEGIPALDAAPKPAGGGASLVP